MIDKIPFFKNLTKDDIKRLEDISILQKYKKDEVFFLEGESPKWLSIIIKGRIKIYKTAPKGKEIFLHEIRPINFIAEIVNFENIPYPASSVFAVNSEVLKIDYIKFKELFLSNPAVTFELLKSVSAKLRVMNEVFVREIVLDSESKVAEFIAENFEAFLELKHYQIAKILNLAPETFSRIVTKFKKSNALIIGDDGKIVDFNKDKISRLYKI